MFALTLSACSVFHSNDRAVSYQSNVTNTRPLAMPEGLNNEKMEDYYPVPKLETQPQAIPVSIVPPGSVLTKQASTTKR